MPEQPQEKIRPVVAMPQGRRQEGTDGPPYAELMVTTNFSFLRGGSHPEELVARAADLGCAAVGITDINTLAGIVRAREAAKDAKIRLVIGCHAMGSDDKNTFDLLLYPTNRTAYGRLCRMLTHGKRRAAKGECNLMLEDILTHQEGNLAIIIPPRALTGEFATLTRRLREAFTGEGEGGGGDDRLSLAAACLYDGQDEARLDELAAFGQRHRVPLVATNDIHYHIPERRPLQDVLTCIRLGCTIDQAGFALFANAERHLKSPAEMAHLFRHHPQAIARTLEIAQRAAFTLDELRYEYPTEICPPEKTLMEHLTERTWAGARERYGETIPDSVRNRLEHELQLIKQLKYPAYFLTVQDIVAFARSRDILCQGRGAAANSAVCYCLGITAVDPARIDLLVERFISVERDEPPDIDVDFEHERREEVIQYIYQKYGRDRAALVAEVISYRRRSAIRDVGKAMGLSLDCVDRLAKSGDWWDKDVILPDRLRELGFDPNDLTLRRAVHLASELLGFPRHLSQHVGGFIISRGPLCECVPIENAAMPDRTVIEWDKDDVDATGMLKMDVLGLGMLTCIRKAIDFVNEEALRHKGTKALRETVHTFSETLYGTQHSTEETHQNLPRSGGLAESHGINTGTVSRIGKDACGRALRTDQSDAKGGSVNSVEHRRGICASEPVGLSEISPDSAGIARGINYSSGAGGKYEHDGMSSNFDLSAGGGRSSASVLDHELGAKAERIDRANVPTPLSALVPQCLSAYPLQFHTVPPEDPAVYDMLCKADSIGVFQVESRAQMTMLPRLKPRNYYDLVIEVAIVRPGPIQGGMVHPYLKRRAGIEPVEYPNDQIKDVLGRTLGVPLFQEQAMRLVMVAAGFTAGEADKLRRAMAAWKRKGDTIHRFGEKIIAGMAARGYKHEFALRVVDQIKGFSEYGFPESHAASFALLVYVSAWLKCHHPAAFAAALINSQPMGFYQPAQIIRDARDHGVTILPIDINHSTWDCSFEQALGASSPALRLGMRLITGLREAEARTIESAVKQHGPFTTIPTLWRTAGVRVATLRALAAADAFNSMKLDRQQALWEILRLRDGELPLFDGQTEEEIPSLSASVPQCLSASDLNASALPTIPPAMRVIHDYAATGLSLKAHPMAFVRETLHHAGITPAGELLDPKRHPHGKRAGVCGLVLVRQRPATASGVLFVTLEDETGVANLVIRPHIYEKFRRAIRLSTALVAWGKIERDAGGQVTHLLVTRAQNLTELTHAAPAVTPGSRDFH